MSDRIRKWTSAWRERFRERRRRRKRAAARRARIRKARNRLRRELRQARAENAPKRKRERLREQLDEANTRLAGARVRYRARRRAVRQAQRRIEELREAGQLADEDQLSSNFHVREFDTKDGTRVPQQAVESLRHLCEAYLEPMRGRFGRATVTSGHRHADYNRGVGGASNSIHIYDHPGRNGKAVAADVVFASGRPADWAAYAAALGAGGVGRYDRSGFVHVDNRQRIGWATARWSG